MLNVSILLLASFLVSCSSEDLTSDNSSTPTQTQSPATPTATSTTEPSSTLRGFVANAFEVSVDGADYADLEDFYSKELDRLPEKVKAAGYDNPTSIHFEAQIGFRDLFQGMDVYALASGSTGYQGAARVSTDGSFVLNFPLSTSTYRIRANKRIRVLVQNADTSSTFCYNFSAMETAAPLDGEPLILREFSTSLTKYDCPASESLSSMPIPTNANKLLDKVSPGMSKSEVLNILGSDGLFISGKQWCWRPATNSEVHANCGRANYLVCQCSVTFDNEDKLSDQSNINTDRLDILNW